MKDFTFKNEWFDLLLMANAAGIKEPWNGNLQFLILAIRDYVRYDVLPTEEEKEHWDHATYYAFERIMEELMEQKEAQEEKERRGHENKVRAGSSRSKQNRAEASRTEQKEAEPSREEKEAEKTEKEKKQKKENKENQEREEELICVEPSSPPVIALPLNDNTEHEITQEEVTELASLYPAVDVMQQLRNMRGWLLSNPSRRKTKRGVRAFITAWLSKEQDRPTARSGTKTTKQMTAEEIMSIPAINPWRTAT